jgi:hypothetical protein
VPTPRFSPFRSHQRRTRPSAPELGSASSSASSICHVHVLEFWYKLKGPKMIFDNQVLVGPTKNGHDHVVPPGKGCSAARLRCKQDGFADLERQGIGRWGIGDAMDGASRAGFVDVLDWWLHSGLPLRYSERALEAAMRPTRQGMQCGPTALQAGRICRP